MRKLILVRLSNSSHTQASSCQRQAGIQVHQASNAIAPGHSHYAEMDLHRLVTYDQF